MAVASRSRSVGRLGQLVAIHGALLADAKRNRAFHAALAARVTPSSRVLDIGAGSGLWAVVAARLGARRVTAVEKEALLIPLIEALAAENGVADRVRVIHGDSRRLDLPRCFDVVVSETVGNLGLEEDVVGIMADARRRLLRPGGALIPESLSFLAAPARVARRPSSAPIERRLFDAVAVHFPRSLAGLRLLAKAQRIAHVDLRRVAPAFRLAGVSARWPLRRAGRVDGVAVWLSLGLAPGIRLDTLSGTGWSPTLFGIEPFPDTPGTLECRFDFSSEPPAWQVSLTRGATSVSRSYAPLYAWGWLMPRLRRRRGGAQAGVTP